MLTAMKDLLDSWPGTLIVVSHDRYLLERVTDQQYGIFDGHLRHLPGGVEEYLRRAQETEHGTAGPAELAAAADPPGPGTGAGSAVREGGLSGADRKSTRLNSSHVAISYAVFCLQEKTCHRAADHGSDQAGQSGDGPGASRWP